MLKKISSITILFFLTFTFSNLPCKAEGSPNYPQDDECDFVQKVYEDAMDYFNTNRGDQKMKKTLLGSFYYYEYNINLWDAQQVELTEVAELKCNQLEYSYIRSKMLADGQKVYQEIVNRLEACLPIGYFKVDAADDNSISKAHYIDEEDKDAFLFYDYPEFEVSLTNISGMYTVKLRVLSKKM